MKLNGICTGSRTFRPSISAGMNSIEGSAFRLTLAKCSSLVDTTNAAQRRPTPPTGPWAKPRIGLGYARRGAHDGLLPHWDAATGPAGAP